ncbi:MAG: hypothetical protein ACTSUL_04015, partial [Promethearchaeota archaeon]
IIRIFGQNHEIHVDLKIKKLDDKSVRFFQKYDMARFKSDERVKDLMRKQTGLNEEEIENFWSFDEHQNVIINKAQEKINDYYKKMILDIIEKISMNGPLCGEHITRTEIIIEDIDLTELKVDTAFTELSMMFYDAIKKCLNEADLVLLEPIYHTIIQLPPDHIKNVVSILSKYSAKILGINQEKEYQATIEILLPVRNSIKFAEDIRSTTSGRAFWQNEFYAYLEVPQNEAEKLITDLKFMKGLAW